MAPLMYVAFGAVFGFILHQGRVTDYDAIIGMFLLKDLHLMGVMGVAIATAAAGLFAVRRTTGRSLLGGPIDIHTKPMRKGLVAGSLLFGAGWALTGA